MQICVVFNALNSSSRKPDSYQVLMVALVPLNCLVLMLILFSHTPGIQVQWVIATLGVTMSLAAAVLIPLPNHF